jgi:hypothetical protein
MDIAVTPTDWAKVADGLGPDEARFSEDKRLYVQFYTRPMMQVGESRDANRPIYRDITHIRILVPGDKLNIIDRVASEDDISRFADHYAKFTAGQGQEVVGTRLDVVPWMTRSKVEEYKYFNIYTVEQLAEASDSVGQKFQGFHSDRDRAKKFLEASSGTNARITELERMIAELQMAKEAQEAAKKDPVKVASKA